MKSQLVYRMAIDSQRFDHIMTVTLKLLLIRTVVSFVIFGLPFLSLGSAGLAPMLVVTVVAVIAWHKAHVSKQAELTARINAGDTGRWIVRLNNVELGTISDAAYASIQRDAMSDPRTATAQMRNLARVLLVLLDKLLLLVPCCSFWITVLAAAFSPEGLVPFSQELLTRGADALAAAAKGFLQVCLVIAPLAATVMFLRVFRCGFQDTYAESTNRRLREHFDTPAQGDISLERCGVRFGLKA